MNIVLNILPHSFFDPNLCPLENDPTKFILSSVQYPKDLHVDIRMKFALSNIHYMDVNSYHKNKGFLPYLVMLCLFSKWYPHHPFQGLHARFTKPFHVFANISLDLFILSLSLDLYVNLVSNVKDCYLIEVPLSFSLSTDIYVIFF